MKRCSRCHEWKSLEAYASKHGRSVPFQPFCRPCQHVYYVQYYKDRTAGFARKIRERTMLQRAVNADFVVNFLASHPCVDCGISDPIVLEFDHVRGSKRASISALCHAPAALETIIAEIEKCEVRCANCHRRRTARSWKRGRQVTVGGRKHTIAPALFSFLIRPAAPRTLG